MKNASSKGSGKKGASKETILTVACELFRSQGFDETTMRDIAQKAGMATGAAYYHFRNKEDLVFAYYVMLQEQSESEVSAIRETSKNASDRLRETVLAKFRQLRADRELVRALARVAADPRSPLSPLSPETVEVRSRAIALMDEVMKGSDLKIGKELSGQLGTILWLYYMMMIFFWSHDRSVRQRRSEQILELTAPILVKLLSFTALPMMGKLNRAISQSVTLALDAAEQN